MERIYPNIWGRGALFAFSGLDGIATFENSMCGNLLAQRVGMAIDKEATELYLRWKNVERYDFSIVASDIILGTANACDPFGFVFVNENTIVGFGKKDQVIPVCHGDLLEQVNLHDGAAFLGEGVCYVLVKQIKGDMLVFSFSRGKDQCLAEQQARKALDTDIEAVTAQKLAYFDCVPVLPDVSIERNRTLAKAFSVMKSQVYTPEAPFHQRWTTPDRLPHRKCWLWDSVFHALGNYHIEPQLAFESFASVFDVQHENGFIPHMFWPGGEYIHTQPPVLAWGLYELYRRSGKKEWVEAYYDKLEKYLKWDVENRDEDQNGLLEWFLEAEEINCICGESGCDNSPRFDDVKPMDAIDFSCFMASEYRAMKSLSQVLGKKDKQMHYDRLYREIRQKINELLYDEADGRYYDRELATGELKKVSAATSFLPLFAGVCDEAQAKRLVEDLQNPETFGTAFGVPSVSKQDATYGSDMWRGPVWINFNYLIIQGLREYGYTELAQRLQENTLQQIEYWYHKDGAIFEFYDSEGKKSPSELARKAVCLKPADDSVWLCAIRDFGWSNTLYAAMVIEGEQSCFKEK